MSDSRTVPPSALPGLDLTVLAAFLKRSCIAVQGDLYGRLLAGGRSNLTYLVGDDTHRWVLRRPPLGHVLPTAHDMRREYRAIAALSPSQVPVPEPVLCCDDPAVLGAPFYLMEHVDGIVYRSDEQLGNVSPPDADRIADGLVDTLVALHSVDPAEVGLADFGRPDGYLTRQLSRLAKGLDSSRTRDIPGLTELGDRLAASVPARALPAIVHGDYRLDNVIIDAEDPGRVAAVLDWEMATLGDPLVDLANALVFWDGLKDLQRVIAAPPSGHSAFPDRERLMERYAAGTGRQLDDLPWYLAFVQYKFAAICEGIHYRHTRGETVGEGFDRIGQVLSDVVALGRLSLADLHRMQDAS
ncbi:phosphotransferase family protein [Streptomyces sp. NPDC058320]|uniref:phosphotransferase family protein n=1 Tax=unclassified Streptomyces TaxID=2593676 RepID=UPI003624E664